ncbi:hypothetical protein EG327_006067 [Venturia inaequalis]|uniref:Uncharacterized protein n=1 Tax=Venturia inaequalis TaxID=5025 RepID=A0A8H3V2G9_VENIN|nr:hypothetical protein EG327_006067 [Venturia inaequalis]
MKHSEDLLDRLVATDFDAVRDRCTRWHHSAMLRDSSIFVDGGVQLFRKAGNTWLGFNKYMFEIDLSKPWDTRTNFSEKRIGRFGDSSMGSNPPNMIRGGLWRGPPNDSRLFTFGGSTFLANTTDVDWKPPTDDKYSLWSYDTASMKWAQYDVSYAIPRRPNWGSVAEAVDLGIGFSLNGQIDRGSSNVMYTMGEYVGGSLSNTSNEQTTYVGGLSIIDMYGKVTARNTSTESLGPPRVAGGLVYAPGFGKTVNGSLITFGGMHSVDLSNNGFRNGALIGFESVSLCDSWQEQNPVWFSQPTSGEIPPPRIDFCVLPMPKSPKDGSSFNFYMYGGYDPIRNIMYDDVWVISLPSFKWIKLNAGGSGPRFGHSCHWASVSHMISIGGSLDAAMYGVETSNQAPPNLETMKCDPVEGVKIFDLNLGTWGTFLPGPQSPPYRVPEQVVRVIGGSGDGNAALNAPLGGFAHPALAAMFNPVKITTHQAGAVAFPAAGANPFQSATESQNHANVKAIAGGIIGGTLGSLILLGLAVMWKRHNTRGIIETDNLDTPNPYDHPPYTPYDDEPKELPSEQVYAKEMKGSELNHELEADVPKFAYTPPAELECPAPQCYEADSTPFESPTLPMAEFLGGTENGSTREGSLMRETSLREMQAEPMEGESIIREGSLREMSMLPDAEGELEEGGLGVVRSESKRVVSALVDDEVADEIVGEIAEAVALTKTKEL